MEKKSFIIHYDKRPLFDELIQDADGGKSYDQVGRLFVALCDFAERGDTDVELSGMTKMLYMAMRLQISADNERYEKRCQANRENGQKGGRPKSEQNPKNPLGYFATQKTQSNPTKPKKPDTDTDTDTDTGTDTELSNESERADAHTRAHARGQYKNVNLTDEQYNKLVEDHGRIADEYVERLSVYLRSHAKKEYTDHDCIIRKWIGEDSAEAEEHKGSFDTENFFNEAVRRSLGDN